MAAARLRAAARASRRPGRGGAASATRPASAPPSSSSSRRSTSSAAASTYGRAPRSSPPLPPPSGPAPWARLSKALLESRWSAVVNVFGSLALAGQFLVEEATGGRLTLPQPVERALCLGFALEFVARASRAPDKSTFLLKPKNVAEVGTFAPPLLAALVADADLPGLTFLRPLRVLRVLRLGLLLPYIQTVGLLPKGSDARGAGDVQAATNIRLFSLISSVVVLLVSFAGLLQEVEGFTWFESLYFTVTTVSTVGLGDVTPKTPEGRAAVVALIVVGAFSIPVQVSRLNELVSERKEEVGEVPKETQPFVLVVSATAPSVEKLKALHADFFSEVRTQVPGMRMVFLTDQKPEFELRAFQELNEATLTLIEGSALSDSDLTRARAGSATSLVLLADPDAADLHGEDMRTILSTIAMKQFSPDVPLLVQVLTPAARRRVTPFLDDERDSCIALDELRLSLIALNCACPGALTFIGNLFRSVVPLPSSALDRDTVWLEPYVEGASYEVYFNSRLKLGAPFVGARFSEVAEALYPHDAILLGLYDGSRTRATWTNGFALNPAMHRIRGGEMAVVLARTEQLAEIAVVNAGRSMPDVLLRSAAAASSRAATPPLDAPKELSDKLVVLADGDVDGLLDALRAAEPPGRVPRPVQMLPAPSRSNGARLNGEVRAGGANLMRLDGAADLVGASTVAVIAPRGEARTADVLDDAEAILTLLALPLASTAASEHQQPPLHVTAELSQTENVRFLVRADDLAGGYCAVTDRVKERAIRAGLAEWQLNEFYASGRLFVPDILDTVWCQTGPGRQLLVLEELVVRLASDGQGTSRGARLRQYVMPKAFVGKTFGSLFLALVRLRSQVAVGLYRDSTSARPVVMAVPAAGTRLRADDRLLVIVPPRDRGTSSRPATGRGLRTKRR